MDRRLDAPREAAEIAAHASTAALCVLPPESVRVLWGYLWPIGRYFLSYIPPAEVKIGPNHRLNPISSLALPWAEQVGQADQVASQHINPITAPSRERPHEAVAQVAEIGPRVVRLAEPARPKVGLSLFSLHLRRRPDPRKQSSAQGRDIWIPRILKQRPWFFSSLLKPFLLEPRLPRATELLPQLRALRNARIHELLGGTSRTEIAPTEPPPQQGAAGTHTAC